MDLLPIAFLLLFVLVGGFIALIADNLGRKWGKKRYTFHKRIRPKYAAMIMAAGTGMLITFLTIVFIALVSSDMRTILLRGRQALAENQQLIHDRNLLQGNIDKLRKESTNLLRTNQTISRQNTDLQGKLTDASTALKQTNLDLRAARADYKSASLSRDRAESQVRTLNGQIQRVRSTLTTLTASLKTAQTALAKTNQTLAKVKEQYGVLQSSFNTLNSNTNDLKRQNLDLGFKIEENKKTIDDLQGTISELTKSKDDLEKSIRDTEDNLQKARLELAMAQRDRDNVINASTGIIQSSRYQPLIFSNGEELFRIEVPAQSSKAQVLPLIDKAIISAGLKAKERGAGKDDENHYARLFEYLDQTGSKVSSETQKDMMAASLAGLASDQVLIVYSKFNAFLKEPVNLGMDKRANPVVYRQGEILAEVRVDARKEKAEILRMLDTLGNKVRTKALDDKMIPASAQDATFGAVTSEQILTLYDEIKSENREVRVRAIARGQIRAADPLLVSFVVR